MAYATQAQVVRRAARLSDAWGAATKPSLADIDAFAEEVSDKVDARLRGLGLSFPVSAGVTEALVSPVADETLILLLDASWPGGAGGAEVASLRESAKERVTEFWAEGYRNEPAIAEALAETTSANAGAASLWTDEPDYGKVGSAQELEALTLPPSFAPLVTRTFTF